MYTCALWAVQAGAIIMFLLYGDSLCALTYYAFFLQPCRIHWPCLCWPAKTHDGHTVWKESESNLSIDQTCMCYHLTWSKCKTNTNVIRQGLTTPTELGVYSPCYSDPSIEIGPGGFGELWLQQQMPLLPRTPISEGQPTPWNAPHWTFSLRLLHFDSSSRKQQSLPLHHLQTSRFPPAHPARPCVQTPVWGQMTLQKLESANEGKEDTITSNNVCKWKPHIRKCR